MDPKILSHYQGKQARPVFMRNTPRPVTPHNTAAIVAGAVAAVIILAVAVIVIII